MSVELASVCSGVNYSQSDIIAPKNAPTNAHPMPTSPAINTRCKLIEPPLEGYHFGASTTLKTTEPNTMKTSANFVLVDDAEDFFPLKHVSATL
jgi:hypothetical protein